MSAQLEQSAGYVVPRYEARGDPAWYHFLHGNVPGHQIDFMYRPEVPQGPLSRQHFSHLARLMKYIEPQTNGVYAFAIGNLSRDDVQYEPGHGGVALIFGLRIHGVTDHAGRQDPPFAHGIATIDRDLDFGALITSSLGFHNHVLGAGESEASYRAYVRAACDNPAGTRGVLERYVARFDDLPAPPPSTKAVAWVTNGAPQPRRIAVVYDDDAPFGEIAAPAARIAAILYRSDVRWTVISNGREDDVPNGVSIRFLARSNVTPSDEAGVIWQLSDLPDDDAAIADLLFAATPVVTDQKPARGGWRTRYSAADPPSHDGAVKRPSWEGSAPRTRRSNPGDASSDISVDVDLADDGTRTLPATSSPAFDVLPRAWAKSKSNAPPAPDRAAMFEIAIPGAPPLPVESPPLPARADAGSPADPTPDPVVAFEAAPDFRSSKNKRWLLVAGFCAVGMAVIAYLTTVAPIRPSPGLAAPTATVAPSAPPPLTTVEPDPAPAPASVATPGPVKVSVAPRPARRDVTPPRSRPDPAPPSPAPPPRPPSPEPDAFFHQPINQPIKK